MTFKIGDEIIMTVDREKGEVYRVFPDGEYKGKIVSQCPTHHEAYDIRIYNSPCPLLCFYKKGNGRNYIFPGMSIRLAEEKVELTPSQWIEGQIPRNYRGYAWICGGIYDKAICGIYKGDTGEEGYTHWMPAELPPPPPVKVEAFGYLEYVKEYAWGSHEKKLQGANFYSQLATAEVLNKYLDVKGKPDRWVLGSPSRMTIDQFIQWHKKAFNDDILLFTSAALDELGIK